MMARRLFFGAVLVTAACTTLPAVPTASRDGGSAGGNGGMAATGGHAGVDAGAGGAVGAGGAAGQMMGSGGASGSGGISGAGGAVAKTISFATTPTTIVLGGNFGASGLPSTIALGDIDGDRRVDLVVQVPPSSGSAPFAAQVFLNNGSAQFFSTTAAATFQSGSASTSPFSSLAVGDIDGDGKTDLAFSLTLGLGGGLAGPLEVQPFLNSGGGAANHFFTSMQAATVQLGGMSSSSTTSFALGDVDGDRKIDLAVVNAISTVGPNAGSITVSTYLNNGGGAAANFFATTAAALSAFPASPQQGSTAPPIALGDVDGDGLPDIAFLNSADTSSASASVSVYLNGAGGAAAKFFATQAALTFQGSGEAAIVPSAIALGDVNGDGRADLAVLGVPASDSAPFDVLVYLNTSR